MKNTNNEKNQVEKLLQLLFDLIKIFKISMTFSICLTTNINMQAYKAIQQHLHKHNLDHKSANCIKSTYTKLNYAT